MKLCKFRITSLIIFAASSLFSINPLLAQERKIHDGLVINYHLNGTVGDRGVCIKMDPPIPGSGWACVYRDNRLYEEITNLLLEAMTSGSVELGCRITYIERSGVQPVILIAECSPREFFGS